MDTKSPEGALPEAHEHYADIQCLLEGEEAVGYALKDGRAPAKPYDPEADIAFWDVPFDTIRLKPGDFYIVWPEDLPCAAAGSRGSLQGSRSGGQGARRLTSDNKIFCGRRRNASGHSPFYAGLYGFVGTGRRSTA